MKKPKGEYAINTVTNALRVLESFFDDEERGVTELSHELALHKNNVFRLLATLEQRGYIEQSPRNDRYRLGVRTLELGQAFLRSRSLLRLAQPVLSDLVAETQESAHLGALQGFEVAHLQGALPNRVVLTASRVGTRLPAHCTALGKVLLGCADESVLAAYDKSIGGERELERRTPATIIDRHKLFEHLRSAANRGFATDVEECVPGLCCCAAPVYDAAGRAVAALSVSGPAFRLGPDRLLNEVVPRVVAAADRLSRDLGHAAQS
jgi:DNA-binding IclR family transcriptional regulator